MAIERKSPPRFWCGYCQRWVTLKKHDRAWHRERCGAAQRALARQAVMRAKAREGSDEKS